MPQVIAVMVAGVGIYAGLKWAAKMLGQAKDAGRQVDEQAEFAKARGRGPKDLGTLEYDQEAKVYRPRAR